MACLAATFWSGSALAESMRLRIAWGGGEHAAWRGRITLSEGVFSQPRCLGNEPDAVGSLWIDGATVSIQARRPLSYQALDVTAEAPLTAVLQCEFTGPTIRDGPRLLTVPLSELVSQTSNQPLDAAGNRLLVRRSPGDALRIVTAVDHLVFAPGEQWDLSVQPYLPALPDNTERRLLARLVTARSNPVRSNQTLWRDEQRLDSETVDEHAAPIDLAVPIPEVEGVYDLVLSLGPPRGRGLFRAGTQEIERRIQVVVLQQHSQSVATGTAAWREAISFDAAQPQWWERLSRFPNWQQLSISPRRLRGQGTAQPVTRDGRKVTRLEPGGWQTYPLPIVAPNSPHVLEVNYPGDQPQTLGVSIIEPGPDGPSKLHSLDQAIRVESPSWSGDGRTCRIVFWPRTGIPYVLLTNFDEDTEAVFGSIRLLEGPEQLPPSAPEQRNVGSRQALAQFDDPDFFATFSASSGIDTDSGRGLTDWVTFYDGGRRLVEYLQHCGFGGAAITCFSQGGAICPLPGVDTTPRFDTGAYFESGQDLFPKDAVELLLRMFDREQLQLTLGVRLSTPLRELESQIRRGTVGIAPVDAEDNEYRFTVPFARGEGPHYNPLDARVQQSVVQLVRDLVHRYGRHPSFAGIRLDIGPESFLSLPGPEWGLDAQTVANFRRDMAAEIAKVAKSPFDTKEMVAGPVQPIWLKWRTQQLSSFYQKLANELESARPDARLTFSLERLANSGSVRFACYPALPRPMGVRDALLAKGVDVVGLAAIKNISIPQPYSDPILFAWGDRGPYQEFAGDALWEALSQATAHRGGTVYRAPLAFQSAGFDQVKLFGSETGSARLSFQAISDGTQDQRDLCHALAQHDVQIVNIGGRRLPLIQSTALTEWLNTYRQLPRDLFRELEHEDAAKQQASPVTVRYLPLAGQTYFYAVNDSPWPVSTRVLFNAGPACVCSEIGNADPDLSVSWSQDTEAGVWQWRKQLLPYELVAGVLNDAQAAPRSVQSTLPTSVLPEMQRMMADVGSRLRSLKSPVSYDRLKNASFDAASASQGPAGWQWAQEPGVSIRRDEQVRFAGAAALRIESSRPVAWVRSQTIAVPKSGRLALQVMLRSATTKSPPLRLAIEGVYQGQPYYRYAQVTPPVSAPAGSQDASGRNDSSGGAASPTAPGTSELWSPFVLQVNDLPSNGLSDLRVRFDLMGAGVVWLDDVRLFDLALTTDEQLQLSKLVALADFQLRQGRLADCERTLRGYWPQFLLRLVPPPQPRVADVPEPVVPLPAPRSQTPDPGGILERVRQMLPRL